MINLLHAAVLGICFHMMAVYLMATCFVHRKLPISPLKYDPDDPSTFPPEEKPAKSAEKKKEKSKEKKKPAKTAKSQGSQIRSAYQAPVGALREANDLETVNGMVSNWGAVQEPMPPSEGGKAK
ncbi:hypothetical protein TELCIR_00367 [Teladorsagia circumcincta]|uniref:Uncharacterized protein n=1 Tax=Teladorsagia circumcincta TaxID=45464 RepID=A0A2G9V4W8_TELCI|nr:hypothetical protein TELCIR_00367 [Teladorsagia circumcincta]